MQKLKTKFKIQNLKTKYKNTNKIVAFYLYG